MEIQLLDKVWIVYKENIDVQCPNCHQAINIKYTPIEVMIIKIVTEQRALEQDNTIMTNTTYAITPKQGVGIPLGFITKKSEVYYKHEFYPTKEAAEEMVAKWVYESTKNYNDTEV